jgi:class 3 adenylate cyclase/tetratricopeptide (TPR) repeat protein
VSRTRTVTVLEADVVGSTELFVRLGVDRADDARRAVFAMFSTAIGAGDGVLIKTMGDGCLATFGSAADAVTAAVAVQRAGARLSARKVPGLGLRVGLAVGDVTEEDDDVFGPAVVTAGRLCNTADENQILVTDTVRMLAGDRGSHDFEAVGQLVLKGFAEPVAACTIRFELTGTDESPLPVALAATPAERVVGRGAELDRLSSALEAARAGQRHAVLIGGEPGVGKTRLVAALARRAHEQGVLVLFGRCEEDLAVAYQPFAEALRAALPALDPEVVAAHVAAHGGEIRRLVPALDADEPVRAQPALEQARLFDAVTDLLHRAAEDRVVLLVLDDLHWAAPSTVALLRHLLDAAPDQRLCVLGTYRDTDIDRSHPLGGVLADLYRRPGVERLALRGLDDQGVEALLSAESDDDLDDDLRALAAAVVERTDGNPFFAKEVLRHLVERGVLTQDDGRWTLSGALEDLDLPEGVLDVVGQRLARLSPEANQALGVAALCGLEFRVRVLCGVPEAGTPDAIVDGLDEAVHARLLVETGPGRFAFTHAIVRQALTRELTMIKRARWHRALGEAIVTIYGDAADLPLDELAHHFTEAAVLGDTAAAARWATAAAREAVDQADQRGAIAVLERALEVIEAVEPLDQTARFDVAAALVERHYALAEALTSIKSAIDAARHLRSGERLLRLGLPRSDRAAIGLCQEALELLDPDAAPIRALAVASVAWLKSAQSIPDFIDDLETATALLADLPPGAPKVAAAVSWQIAFAGLGLPGAAARLRLVDEALAVDPEAEDPWWDEIATGINITGELDGLRGHLLLALGRRADFEANLAHRVARTEATGEATSRGVNHARVALLDQLDGRLADVPASAARVREAAPGFSDLSLAIMALVAVEEGRFDEVLAIMEPEPTGWGLHLPSKLAIVGRARLETGDLAGAIETLDRLVRDLPRLARDWSWSLTLAETTEIVAGLGAAEHAGLLVDELAPYAGELVVGGLALVCAGAADRYRGMLLSLLRRHDEAVAALTAALALEESVGSPTFTARTRYWLARALLQRDGPSDRDRASREIARSLETAARIGMSALVIADRDLACA